MERLFEDLKRFAGTSFTYRANARQRSPSDSKCAPPRRISRGDIKYAVNINNHSKREWLFFGIADGVCDFFTRERVHGEFLVSYQLAVTTEQGPIRLNYTDVDNIPPALTKLLADIGREDIVVKSVVASDAVITIAPVLNNNRLLIKIGHWQISTEPFTQLAHGDLRIRFSHVTGAVVMQSTAEVYINGHWIQLQIFTAEYNLFFAPFRSALKAAVPPTAYFRRIPQE